MDKWIDGIYGKVRTWMTRETDRFVTYRKQGLVSKSGNRIGT